MSAPAASPPRARAPSPPGAPEHGSTPTTRARRGWMTLLWTAVGLGLVVVVLSWLAPDLEAVWARVELRPLGWIVALLGAAVSTAVTGRRWQILAERMGGAPLPLRAYLHALVVTRLAGQFVPSLAMDLIGRGVALRRMGSDRAIAHTMMQVIVERALDVAIPICVIAAYVACPPTVAPAVHTLAGLAAVALAAAVLCTPALPASARLALAALATARRWTARPAPRVDGSSSQPAEGSSADRAARVALSPRDLVEIGILGWVRTLVVTVQCGGIAHGLGLDLTPVDLSIATQVAQLAGVIGVTPGALGIQEAGWAGALRWLGYDSATASVMVVGARAAMIALFAVLAAITWPLYARRRRDDPSPAV